MTINNHGSQEVRVRSLIKWLPPVRNNKEQQRSIDDARTIGLYIMYVLLRKVDNKKKELRMGPTFKKIRNIF